MDNLVQKYAEFKHITNQQEALEAVRQDGAALQFVRNQTEEICLEAVKQSGYALSYVNKDIIDNYLNSLKEEMLVSPSKYIREIGKQKYGEDALG